MKTLESLEKKNLLQYFNHLHFFLSCRGIFPFVFMFTKFEEIWTFYAETVDNRNYRT